MPFLVHEGNEIDTTAELLTQLRRMDPDDFEHFIADLWTEMGWNATVTQQTGDRGVDVVATRELPYDRTVAIQAKRHGESTTIGRPQAQQYGGALMGYDADEIVIVTTGSYTSGAKEYAEQSGVKIINGDELSQLIFQHDAEYIVADYLWDVDLEADPIEQELERRELQAEAASQSTSNLPETPWFALCFIGTGLGIITYTALFVYREPVLAWLLVPAAILIAAGIYNDSTENIMGLNWPENRLVYLLASGSVVLAPVAGFVYSFNRMWLQAASTESTSDESTESTEPSESDETSSSNDLPGGGHGSIQENIEEIRSWGSGKR